MTTAIFQKINSKVERVWCIGLDGLVSFRCIIVQSYGGTEIETFYKSFNQRQQRTAFWLQTGLVIGF